MSDIQTKPSVHKKYFVGYLMQILYYIIKSVINNVILFPLNSTG